MATGKLNTRVTPSKQSRNGGNPSKPKRILPRGVHVGEIMDQRASGNFKLHLSNPLPENHKDIHNENKECEGRHLGCHNTKPRETTYKGEGNGNPGGEQHTVCHV